MSTGVVRRLAAVHREELEEELRSARGVSPAHATQVGSICELAWLGDPWRGGGGPRSYTAYTLHKRSGGGV